MGGWTDVTHGSFRLIHHFYETCSPQKMVLVNYFYLLEQTQAAEETHSASPAPGSVCRQPLAALTSGSLSETWLGC